MQTFPLRSINNSRSDTTNPCGLTLLAKGYKLSLIFDVDVDGKRKQEYTAEKEGVRIIAENEVELLGLVTMWEARGPSW